ncbi:hypothetical protein HK102_005180, partial [Quaeritorhiza haematococci]
MNWERLLLDRYNKQPSQSNSSAPSNSDQQQKGASSNSPHTSQSTLNKPRLSQSQPPNGFQLIQQNQQQQGGLGAAGAGAGVVAGQTTSSTAPAPILINVQSAEKSRQNLAAPPMFTITTSSADDLSREGGPGVMGDEGVSEAPRDEEKDQTSMFQQVETALQDPTQRANMYASFCELLQHHMDQRSSSAMSDSDVLAAVAWFNDVYEMYPLK